MYDLFSIILLILIILTVGCHIFSIKYIQIKINNHVSTYIIVSLIIASLIFFLISRYCIYHASKNIPIAVVHAFMNLSVFVTLFLSLIILKSKLNYGLFIVGLLILIVGIYIINKSII